MESLRKLLVLGCCLAVAGCAAQGTGMLPGAPGPSGLPTLRQPDRSPLVLGNAKRKSSGNPAIYLFKGEPDACCPTVGLVNIGNTLYGTSYQGGTDNLGTLYSVTTGGTETVMHSFTGIPDGEDPQAALTNVNGTLYGTTYYGGNGHGTIFSVTSTGYKLLYDCESGSTSDCTEPDSTMIYDSKKKALYGTGYRCGSSGCIFKVSLAGKKPKVSILYSFTGSPSSPGNPSGVVLYKNALYGTSEGGGANGYGAVFKVTLSGKESIIYSFKNEPDGAYPAAPLVVMGSALYGTTSDGGEECGGYGCGTVFKITPSGKETKIYSFTAEVSKHDGQHPATALIVAGGTLYGTTASSTYGSGSVYAVKPSGSESLVTDFQLPTSDPPGWPETPEASVLSLGGKLYGTTASSSGDTGVGTVFAL